MFNSNFPLDKDQLPDHNQFRDIGPDDHHKKFTEQDHFEIDHKGIPGIPLIDDNDVSLETIWSSQKINDFINDLQPLVIDDTTISNTATWSSQKINNTIQSFLDDTLTTNNNIWSSQKIQNRISSLIDDSNSNGSLTSTWSIAKNIDYLYNLGLYAISLIDDSKIDASYLWSSQKINDEISNLINDSKVTDENTWSSQKIYNILKNEVDSLTPGYILSGDIGLFNGGGDYSKLFKIIESCNISTPSNVSLFGNLTQEKGLRHDSSSNGINNIGVFIDGLIDVNIFTNKIEYVYINQANDAQFFGNTAYEKSYISAISDGVNDKCLFAGGFCLPTTMYNNIEYIMISNQSNSNSFGLLDITRRNMSGESDGTNERGFFISGEHIGTNINTINFYNVVSYVNISNSTSNATFCKNLSKKITGTSSASNKENERFVVFGGNTTTVIDDIEYFNMSNGSDAGIFGKLIIKRTLSSSTSNGLNNKAILGGGIDFDMNSLDVITHVDLTIFSDTIAFGSLSQARGYLSATSNS